MEGPYLPGGSGGEEPPEDLTELDERALAQYERRFRDFEETLAILGRMSRPKKRRNFSDYTAKNCEEAYSSRWTKAKDGVGRPDTA